MKNVLYHYSISIISLITLLVFSLNISAQSDRTKDTSWNTIPSQTNVGTSYIPIDSSISINLHAFDNGNGFASLKWSLTVQDSSILSGCHYKVFD